MSRSTWSKQGGLYSDRSSDEWKDLPSRDRRDGHSRLPRGRSRSPIHDRNRAPSSSMARQRRRCSPSPDRHWHHCDRVSESSRRRQSRSSSSSRRSSRSSRYHRTPSPRRDRSHRDISEGELEEEEEEEEEEEVPRTKVEFNCEVCGVKATNFEALQKHFAGAKHQKNLRKVGYGRNFKAVHEIHDPQMSNKILRCILCKIILTGAEVSVHVSCDTHLKALEKVEDRFKDMNPDKWFEEVTKKSESPKGGYACSVCNVNLPNFEGFQMHIKGKRHQKATKLAMNDESVLPGENVQPFWCQLCNIYCTNQESLDVHLRGKKHIKMLKNKGIVDEVVKHETSDEQLFPTAGPSTTPAIVPNPFVENEILSEPPKVLCTLCNVTLSSNTDIHAHLSTTQHYMALRKAPGKRLNEILVPADP